MTTPSAETLEAWLETAVAVAGDAAKVLVEHFERGVEIEHKSNPIDLVTEADRQAERVIVEGLSRAFPNHAILAEESGRGGNKDPAALRWTVDPLDGTTNFAHGLPHYSVLLALYDGSEGLLAVTVDPMRLETFVAWAGGGAWLRIPGQPSRRLCVTHTQTVERSLLATGFAYDRATAERNNMAEFGRLIHRVRGIRRAGSAGLDLAWVAAGRLDGYWEYHLNPWDWSAGALLVREAGGVVQSIGGGTWSVGDDSLVASGDGLQAELQAALRG